MNKFRRPLPERVRARSQEAEWKPLTGERGESIATALGVAPDSPFLAEIGHAFFVYHAHDEAAFAQRSLDSRQLKRVRKAAAELSAALDGCNDSTWFGLLSLLRSREPASLRDDEGQSWHLSLHGLRSEVERLQRAATPAQGGPKMQAERFLLSKLIDVYQRATGRPAGRIVSKPRKWKGLETEHKESGPFREFLEACKRAYGLEAESWIEPLKDVLPPRYGEESARE